MQIDSLVETKGDFTELKKVYPKITFPTKGDTLVVSNIMPHPNDEVRAKGIVLLYFYELPDTPGLCDKNIKGEDNFIELQPPVGKLFQNMANMEIPEPV